MIKLGKPLPAWFTPAAEIVFEQMCRENPEIVVALDTEGRLRESIEGKVAEKMTAYRTKMDALLDDGDNAMNAHFAVAREVFGAAAGE